MPDLIKDPLEIMTKKDVHQLYEQKGMLPENNTIDVKMEEMQLCHKHWPENFESLYDIGVKAFERFLVNRCHLMKLFNIEEVEAETWRQHFVLDRCVLHMLQLLHEAFTKYYEGMTGEGVDEKTFIGNLHVFGGRFRQLAPTVPVQDYFHLFTVCTEMLMDFIALTGCHDPLSHENRAIILKIWAKIIHSVKPHFIYGWHHKMYVMNREELEYFSKVKPVESTRSKLISKLTRLLSREGLGTSSEDKSSVTRKNSHSSKESTSGSSKARRESSKTRPIPITPANSREEEIIQSQPLEICDIKFDFLNSPQQRSPLNISSHF